jgi:hypothetical protein
MLFSELTADSRKHLKQWLAKHTPKKSSGKSASRTPARQKARAASASH